tara:strand:- start:783 stop:1349 length:567 start_codon:yes stop_codon:yes gene_type:complete
MKTKTIYFDHQGILSNHKKTANIFLIILGSFLIAVLAQISIPLPFSPVPITGQTVGVILVGGLLGANRGAISILCYILEGVSGFPVFAQMNAGIHVLIGPTGGYLWGFVIAAFLIGYLSENGFTSKPFLCFLSCLLATILILVIGTIYLAAYKVGLNKALVMGFYPFLIGGVVKSILCTIILINLRKF